MSRRPGGRQVESKSSHNNMGDSMHMFTFPFATVYNTLASCSKDLDELNTLRGIPTLHDTIFSTNKLVKSTIVDSSSMRSLSPGVDIDGNIMNFCLAWYSDLL